MRHPVRNVLASAAMIAAPVAIAHHGFGTFVMDEDIEITGTVTGLDFVNPHAWLYLDVAGDDGDTVAMRCEMRSANTLRRSGWTPELFPEGEQITITGAVTGEQIELVNVKHMAHWENPKTRLFLSEGLKRKSNLARN